jgi:ribose-phosphate pyrophosphokinase
VKIFSGTSNKPLAEKIAKDLNMPLSELEVFVFPDGEKRIRIIDKVLGEDVVVVQSTAGPTDENYMQLFFIVDGLKRNGAKSITIVMPYLGYQRQDHMFREGEAVSIKVIADILKILKVDKVVALDLHSIKIKETFEIPLIHLSALDVFAEKIKKENWTEDATLVSPDMGGIRRIKQLSEMLNGMPYAAVEKNRDLATGKVTGEKIKGKVGRRAIIVDDMISSGGTIVMAANLLRKKGVKEIVVFVTHPVFSEKAPTLLQKSKIDYICVADTIVIPKEKRFPKLKVVSVSKLIAENINHN